MFPRRTLLSVGVALLTALDHAFGFSLASSARASATVPRGEDELQTARRRAVLILSTGVGAGLARSAAAAGAPPRARGPQVATGSFRLPLAVGLGTCCPCDVQDAGMGEEEAVCDATYQQVSEGLDAGYRFIDTATHYRNERSVGRALGDAVAAGIVSRADVILCTKVWFDDMGYASTLKSVAASNERLSADVGGADVVLIHFPGPNDSVQSPAKNKRLRQESWKALEQLRSEGRVKAIGVSNYVRRHIKELLAGCAVKPDVVELEIHPFNQQPELVALCRSNGIQVMGFSPLAHGDLPVLTNSVLAGIAADHGRSVPQVVLRWMLQENIVGALARPLHPHKQHHPSPQTTPCFALLVAPALRPASNLPNSLCTQPLTTTLSRHFPDAQTSACERPPFNRSPNTAQVCTENTKRKHIKPRCQSSRRARRNVWKKTWTSWTLNFPNPCVSSR